MDIMSIAMKALPLFSDLKRLEIKELENRTIPLTDVTGYLGFLQMKSLCVLDVGPTLVSNHIN